MNYGCAQIPRGIRRHKSYRKKPFTDIEALLDLLLDPTFKRSRIVEGMCLKEGQSFIKKKQKAREWGWTVKRVRRFLISCERARGEPWEIRHEIVRATATNPGEKSYEVGTILTWVNYDLICKSEGEGIGDL